MRAHFAVRLLSCATAVICPLSANAWGPSGHIAASNVAELRLCDAAESEVGRLLSGESLADASLWPDRIRGEDRWRHTGPWHYLNVPDGQDIRRAQSASRGRGDVLEAVERFSDVLRSGSSSRAERRDALSFVAHFVVDIHQPLHIGRASDRGGNEISVMVGGDRTNLHAAWDSRILRAAGLRLNRLVPAVETLASVMAESGGDLGEPTDWANESQTLRPHVYDFKKNSGRRPTRLDDGYLRRAQSLIQLRLAQAGLRLAAHLNGLFCPG